MAAKRLIIKPQPAREEVYYHDLANLDNLIKSKPGMFWCYTHLLYLPLTEQSADPRFCKLCHSILMAEYRDTVSTRGKRSFWWAPVDDSSHKKTTRVLGQDALIMSTLNKRKIEVDKINLTPRNGRCRKLKALPVDRIKQLSFKGMGSKAIAARLQGQGFSVSYKTGQDGSGKW
jgi:hypothetical protein